MCKLDLEIAYDYANWNFLLYMEQCGFLKQEKMGLLKYIKFFTFKLVNSSLMDFLIVPMGEDNLGKKMNCPHF